MCKVMLGWMFPLPSKSRRSTLFAPVGYSGFSSLNSDTGILIYNITVRGKIKMFSRDSMRAIINTQKRGIVKILILLFYLITLYSHKCGQKTVINRVFSTLTDEMGKLCHLQGDALQSMGCCVMPLGGPFLSLVTAQTMKAPKFGLLNYIQNTL